MKLSFLQQKRKKFKQLNSKAHKFTAPQLKLKTNKFLNYLKNHSQPATRKLPHVFRRKKWIYNKNLILSSYCTHKILFLNKLLSISNFVMLHLCRPRRMWTKRQILIKLRKINLLKVSCDVNMILEAGIVLNKWSAPTN